MTTRTPCRLNWLAQVSDPADQTKANALRTTFYALADRYPGHETKLSPAPEVAAPGA